jgi:hypothetical protein
MRGEITEQAGEDSPPEYRDLVKKYFRELARQGAKEEDKVKE